MLNNKKNYTQSETIKIIKLEMGYCFALGDYRIIKIAGGKFQESGLLDLMILIRTKNKKMRKIWIEIKRNWNDQPTKLQEWNIISLDFFGYETGIAVGREFKQYLNGGYKEIIETDIFLQG